MARDPRLAFPLMCLTQEGLGVSPSAQAESLAAAGARIVQLRMKGADRSMWVSEAAAAAAACRSHGSILLVNDSVEVALESGADGAHLGRNDGDWAEARRRLGPSRILGGTVNGLDDARRALAAGCLDYVGLGPLRFTRTKAVLAPVLGLQGVRALVAELGPLPAWVIGGVLPSDMAALRDLGAAGAAVSSFLHGGGPIGANLAALVSAWEAGEPAHLP